MDYKNWILKKYQDLIKPVLSDFGPYYAELLLGKGVHAHLDLVKAETFIDWARYPGYYSFWYYFEGCEQNITNRLKNTQLAKYESVLMDFGVGNPVCEIPTGVFIDNWLDFVIGAVYMSTAVTTDGKLVMEFVKGDYLYSNFLI
ncbi:MAG: hypothetical protein EOP45_01450 [Sphingobacteriaceae bacterium]|nr:MAG: hypothetical protein EOP45_01450 [Sphingobacteriaceae bacterium]